MSSHSAVAPLKGMLNSKEELEALELAARYMILVFIGAFLPRDPDLALERRMMAHELLKGNYEGLGPAWPKIT